MDTQVQTAVPDGVLSALMAELSGKLTYYACRLLRGNVHDAHEVVQDAFFRYWSKGAEVAPEGVRPWLFRTCRNLCYDRLRRERCHSRLQFLPIDHMNQEDCIAAAAPDPADEIIDLHTVRGMLDSLPKHHRAMIMALADGYHYQEIATALRIPVGTVKSRSNYVRTRMQHLASCGTSSI